MRATPTAEASWPSSRIRRSAGPFSAVPAMIGDTATVCSRLARMASAMPGTASSGPIETIGFEGATTTTSAPAIASSTPGPGEEAPAPSKRTDETGTSWRSLTKYSWKPTSSPSAKVTIVATLSSVMGSSVGSRSHPEVMPAVISARPTPAARLPVR